ncbi:unnamed protein product [Didymodactylos carnosus]|uniref:G-protein coupled receptors family 1 profile domain-containing protein n=1 Tax=Didymodactylos carnosus TaxID=1234261 RepID=A0A814L0L7_9BILA|nr:unnamed protein product [Didymodactylos carnosus]CAF1059420.1 unnamed protein product [Didymodactylos carnosus]CAF3657442.1 unnamed protein product [Didymodactylos carnosus]CAF3827940.1 unnamed protein product [Didymodactylos carnosus]
MNRYMCNDTSPNSYLNATAYVIQIKLVLASIYVLPVISLIGNSLTIIVLQTNQQLNRSSFAVYAKTLAISDTLVLFCKLLSYENKRHQRPFKFLCIAFQFLAESAVLVSVWTVVLITTERAIIVLFPLHIKKFISGYRARVLVILSAVLITISSSRLLVIKMDKNINTRCQPRQEWIRYIEISLRITEFAYIYIPLTIITVGNCLSCWTLRRALNERRSILKSAIYKHKRLETNENQLIIMLFIVTVMFIFYFMPFTVMRIIPRTGLFGKCFTSSGFSSYLLIRTLCEFMKDLNFCSHFFIYCISGRSFRNALGSLIREKIMRSLINKPRTIDKLLKTKDVITEL